MYVREIPVSIGVGEKNEITVDFAGSCGEHNAAVLAFAVPENLRGENMRYFVEYYRHDGVSVRSDDLEIENGIVCYLIPRQLSTQLKTECFFNVVLVENENVVYRYKPVRVILKFSPTADGDEAADSGYSSSIEAFLDALNRNCVTLNGGYYFNISVRDWITDSENPVYIYPVDIPITEPQSGRYSVSAMRRYTGCIKKVVIGLHVDDAFGPHIISDEPFDGVIFVET